MSKEQIIPMGEYVLIKTKKEANNYDNVLLRVDIHQENRGVILAVGDKVNTDENSTKLEVNDEVIYIPGNGVKVTNAEDSDELISVKNIIGKVKIGEYNESKC